MTVTPYLDSYAWIEADSGTELALRSGKKSYFNYQTSLMLLQGQPLAQTKSPNYSVSLIPHLQSEGLDKMASPVPLGSNDL